MNFRCASARSQLCLTAPSGAGCFLAGDRAGAGCGPDAGLNAPSGAGCFLTRLGEYRRAVGEEVLMHLLVLGAFWPLPVRRVPGGVGVLMHLLVLGAF